jgi:hypothetical protein
VVESGERISQGLTGDVVRASVLRTRLVDVKVCAISDVGRLTPGSAGHAVALDAPSHHHLAYRPGVPLIRQTIGPLA